MAFYITKVNEEDMFYSHRQIIEGRKIPEDAVIDYRERSFWRSKASFYIRHSSPIYGASHTKEGIPRSLFSVDITWEDY